MKSITYLDGSKRKYKGNIHTHSTEATANTHGNRHPGLQGKGYDFMCLSDHEIYWKSDAFNEDSFIMLSGYEMACEMSWRETGQQYHLHGLLDKSLGSTSEFQHDEEHDKPDYAGLETIQAIN